MFEIGVKTEIDKIIETIEINEIVEVDKINEIIFNKIDIIDGIWRT